MTNGCEDIETLFANVMTNPKFLYSAFSAFDNRRMMTYLESNGLKLKVERGQRVFPESDKSSDVIRVLVDGLRRAGVFVHLNQGVEDILTEDGQVTGVRLVGGKIVSADAVILATGGMSYPSTGSTGDGYRMAETLEHRIVLPTPSLVPMHADEEWVRQLQGLSLRNIGFSLMQGKRCIYKDFGEMMFTHFGITGPVVLSGSTGLSAYLKKGSVTAQIDLKPALSEEQLDARIRRDFEKYINKQIRNAMVDLLPARLIPVVLAEAGIDEVLPVHDLTKAQRMKLIGVCKHLSMTISGVRGWNEAIITKGGVSVKDVYPSTMGSRKVKGLYFAGEVLDLDAQTGGYNLQIAWSTAYVAGISAAQGL